MSGWWIMNDFKWLFYIFYNFIKLWYCHLIFLNYFIVVQLQLSAFTSHHSSPHPSQTHLPSLLSHPLLGFVHVVPENPSPSSLYYPLPPPFWLLSDCSEFQCLWLYFAYFFLLLIRSQLKVRSYGICPSSPGLFHLA